MPRIQRAFVDGFIYHVLNRGNGKRVIFHESHDYQTFTDLMREAKRLYSIKILAYCLMPNHFHMVLLPVKAREISQWMQWLMTSHVRRYHQLYATNGHVWQGRYKSFIVEPEEHLLTMMRYVEANPVRSGLVGSAKDWKWSSHGEVLGRKPRDVTDEAHIELVDSWDAYVDAPLTGMELESLRQSVNRQCPFGSLLWQSRLCEKLGLESTLRPKGRPRNLSRHVKLPVPFS